MTDQEQLDKLAMQLAEELKVPPSEITVHICGRTDCKHIWNGPDRDIGGGVITVTCSQCGADYFTANMWRMP